MANYNFSITLIVLIILLVQHHAKSAFVTTNLNPKLLGFRKETLSHFHFFMHDIRAQGSATALTIITPQANYTKPGGGPTNPSDGVFGTVNVIDEPLTEGPELNSTLVGRVQGVYVQASEEETALDMVTNYVFLQGKFNGSSITVVGRNPVYDEVREMPVIGGTGLLRFARGYVQVSTHSFNPEVQGVTIEYNVYVTHYIN